MTINLLLSSHIRTFFGAAVSPPHKKTGEGTHGAHRVLGGEVVRSGAVSRLAR